MANLYNATTGLGGLTKVRLIVVILPSKDATIYADVKWWGDYMAGIPTICVSPDALRRVTSKKVTVLSWET
jgi:hypothetical protein